MKRVLLKKPWSEKLIAHYLSQYVFDKKCTVLVPNCGWTGYECDVLAVTDDCRIIDVEVKISRADLKADAGKGKWWEFAAWRQPRTRVAHPRKVWKHYYCLPAELWTPDLEQHLGSASSGVILITRSRYTYDVVVQRRAKPNTRCERLTPPEVMHIARLANLRMWDAIGKRGYQ